MLVALLLVLGGVAQGSESQEFVAQDAGFAVMFPGAPTRVERALETPEGPSRSISYQVNQGGCGYLAQRVDFPAGAAGGVATRMLEKQRESLRKKNEEAGGVVVSETAVSLGQYPGLETVEEPRPGTSARSRSFAVGEQMFTVAFTKGPGCGVPDTAVSQYLDSLRLIQPNR